MKKSTRGLSVASSFHSDLKYQNMTVETLFICFYLNRILSEPLDIIP